MTILSYANLQPNAASLTKGGTDRPSFQVDFSGGMPSGITLGLCSVGVVNIANFNVTHDCLVGVSTSGTVATVNMATCGSSGAAAANGAQFRFRITQNLSSGGRLVFDAYVLVQNPVYEPNA